MSTQRTYHSGNWPLVAGAAIVLLLGLVAAFGPGLAPRDPLERTLVAFIGGARRGVPFPPFLSAEFPLGSDQFGRDTLSRLLWAVRPTLLLVLLVAAIRLGLGYLVGIVAGWSAGSAGRAASGLLSAASAVPVLVVALAAIVAVGIERGLIAFIIGMALTGWADTAQSVSAQTVAVRAQLYVQAARAMGGSSFQIIVRHVLRHTLPLAGTLFAFEVSATLMLTAALGFLGYYIGGGVWIALDGNVIPIAQRAAGPPELGQMLASALVRFTSRPPWQMIFPGLTIFVSILGFVLLGEGLRRRQSLLAQAPSGPIGQLVGRAGRGLDSALLSLAARWSPSTGRAVGGAAGLLALGLGLIWWQSQPSAAAEQPRPAALAAQAQPWASGRGDPGGTLWGSGGAVEPRLAWSFRDPAGLAGGPAIAADGTTYLVGRAGTLYALDAQGAELWQVELGQQAVGGPALAADGSIYVADAAGGLSAIAPDGKPRWRFQSAYRSESTSGPLVGPDGTIYYTVVDAVQAVTPAGGGRWVGASRDLPYLDQAPRLSAAGDLLFLKQAAFRAADGAQQPITIVPNEQSFDDPSFLVGANGFNYYRSGHSLIRWRQVEAGLALTAPLSWDFQGSVLFTPSDAGVRPDGTTWLLYGASYASTRLIWISPEGQVVGNSFFPLTGGRAIAAADEAIYICGAERNRSLTCAALSLGSAKPQWQLGLEVVANPIGGALVDGRLYVATVEGDLFVIGR